MRINRYAYLIYSLFFAISLGWFATGWMSYSSSADFAPPVKKLSGRTASAMKLPDRSLIISKNVFNAEMTAPKADELIKTAESVMANSTFDGKLLGVVVSETQSMAIISYNDKKYILKLDEEKDGIVLDDVGLFHAVVSRGGERFRLILKSDGQGGAKSALTEKVTSVSGETQKVTIPRKVVVEELADVNKVIKSVLIMPFERNGKFEGYRVRRMTNTSVFNKIGVEKNDVIMRLNGKSLDSPTVFFDALKNAENLSSVSLDILRNGKKMTLYVEIEG
jgi:general secretion pathway protein C